MYQYMIDLSVSQQFFVLQVITNISYVKNSF